MKIQNTPELWEKVSKLPSSVKTFLFSDDCNKLCEKLEKISGKSGYYFLQLIFDILTGELNPYKLREKLKKDFKSANEEIIDEISSLIGRGAILRFENYTNKIYGNGGESKNSGKKNEKNGRENKKPLKDSAY